MKSWHIILVLFIAIAMQGSMAAQNASDIGFGMRPNPYDAYAAAIQDILPRLEPYLRAYKEAEKQGDKVQQEAMLHQIVLRNTLENWRWQFYQYGIKNVEKLSDRERAAWEMVNTMFAGRTAPPNPENMLRIPPEQIRDSIIREKEEFNKTLTAFDSGNFGSKPLPTVITPTAGVRTRPAPSADTSVQKSTPPAAPMPSLAETKSTRWPWIIGAILLLAVASGILLKLRCK